MLILNKILPLFVLPFGWVCAFMLLAAWRKRWWPALVALAILVVASVPWVGSVLTGTLERQYAVVPVGDAGPADAVVVLGGLLGASNPEGTMTNWSDPVERFEAALALRAAGRAPIIIFTAPYRFWRGQDSSEGAELKRLAIARGVPPESILLTATIDNTATEAAAVAGLMREHGFRHVILVTSAWHMPRSAFLFRRVGVDFQPFPVDLHIDPEHRTTPLDFVPNAGAWQSTENAIREWYGLAFYHFFPPRAPRQDSGA